MATERVFLNVDLGSGDEATKLKHAVREAAARQDLTMSGLARRLLTREIVADVIPISHGEAHRNDIGCQESA